MSEAAQPLSILRTKNRSGYGRPILPMAFFIAMNFVLILFFYRALSSLSAFFLLGFTAYFCLRNLLSAWDGRLRLDITRPLAIYSLLFLLYYVLACYMYLFATFSRSGNPGSISALMLLGYLAFWFGIDKSGLESKNNGAGVRLGWKQTRALLAVCYFGATMVAFHYVWMAAQGAYFTHATAFEQPTTLAGALWNVFAGSFEYPLVLILGLLIQLGDATLCVHARRFFNVYLIGILLIYLTSGQFRPAMTVTVFALVNFCAEGGRSLKFRQIVLVGFLGVVGLLVIQAARVMIPQAEIAKSENQIVSSAQGAVTSLVPALKDARSEMFDIVAYRATLPIQFLSDIIDAIHAGRPHTHGAVTAWTIFGLTPRLLWPEKPKIEPPQILMERYLDLEEMDNSPGPVNYFYTEFGWTGVVLGFFSFGLLLGYATKRTIARNSVFPWLFLLWSWGAVAIVDTDLIGGVLLAIRQAVVVYLLYGLFLRFVSPRPSHRHSVSAHKVAP